MTNFLAIVCAIALWEHRGEVRYDAVGRDGDAGPLQITAVMARDFARITGEQVGAAELKTWAASTNVARAFFAHYGKGRWTPEQCAAAWNAGPDMRPWPAEYVRGFIKYYDALTKGTIMFDGKRAVAVDVACFGIRRKCPDTAGVAAEYVQSDALFAESALDRKTASDLIDWLADERARGASLCAWGACRAFRVIGEYARRTDDAAALALAAYDTGLNAYAATGWHREGTYRAAERVNGYECAARGTSAAAGHCLRITKRAAETGALFWVTAGNKCRVTRIPSLLSVGELVATRFREEPEAAWLLSRIPEGAGPGRCAPWYAAPSLGFEGVRV